MFGDFSQSARDGGRVWREKGDDPRWRSAQRILAVSWDTTVAQMGAFNIPK